MSKFLTRTLAHGRMAAVAPRGCEGAERGRFPSRMDGSGAFVKVECGGGRFTPVKAARLAESALAQSIAQIWIGGDRAQFAGEIRDVLGIGNQGGVADDFGEGAAVGAKNRATAGPGFDRGHTEASVDRG